MLGNQDITQEGCGWTSRREDNLSTFSGNSDTIINIPADGRRSPDEATSIRFSNVRRSTVMAGPVRRKVAVSVGALLLLVIGGVVFSGVYSTFGSGGGKADKSLHNHEYEVIAKALPYADSGEGGSAKLQGDQPSSSQGEMPAADAPRGATTRLRTSSGNVYIPVSKTPTESGSQAAKEEEVPVRQPPAPASVKVQVQPIVPASNGVTDNPTTTTTAKTKKKKGGSKVEEIRRTLPADADKKSPVGLLYEMKLIPSAQKINDVVRFQKCEHVFDNKKFLRGWKASLSVNATVAGISEDVNKFIGYGKSKNLAKEMAAQYALTTIYPGNVTYTIDPDDAASEIKPYCNDDEEEDKNCNKE